MCNFPFYDEMGNGKRKMLNLIISNRDRLFLSLSQKKNDVQQRAYLRDFAIPRIRPAAGCISRRMMQNHNPYTFIHLFIETHALFRQKKNLTDRNPKSEPPASEINHGDFTQQPSLSPQRINHLMFRLHSVARPSIIMANLSHGNLSFP